MKKEYMALGILLLFILLLLAIIIMDKTNPKKDIVTTLHEGTVTINVNGINFDCLIVDDFKIENDFKIKEALRKGYNLIVKQNLKPLNKYVAVNIEHDLSFNKQLLNFTYKFATNTHNITISVEYNAFTKCYNKQSLLILKHKNG